MSGCLILLGLGLLAIVISVLASILPVAWPILLVALLIPIGYKLYECLYFRSAEFDSVKARVRAHIRDCNELNDHIESLKSVRLGTGQVRYGTSEYRDKSRWNYKRPELGKIRSASYVHSCSRTVCDNSRKNPMQYVCKYFGFKADADTLAVFEQALNDFSAVEDGKKGLMAQRATILASISGEVPQVIQKHSSKRLERELGFEEVDLSDAWYPKFVFQYVSPGGNASMENVVTMNPPNLEAMVRYMNDRIRWEKSVAHQRSLMTRALRTSILERDKHTCQKCGVSLADEPHLLLEVDHIVPVARGGLTCVDNLQTLCWRCNRSKGAKLVAVGA